MVVMVVPQGTLTAASEATAQPEALMLVPPLRVTPVPTWLSATMQPWVLALSSA